MSGAQIVFGIARRVPPLNTPNLPSNTRNVSGSTKQMPHTTIENILIHESNLLTTFYNMTSRPSGHNFEPFLPAAPRFETRLPLARLVEAEIVSPYRGILINVGMGNSTMPFIQP